MVEEQRKCRSYCFFNFPHFSFFSPHFFVFWIKLFILEEYQILSVLIHVNVQKCNPVQPTTENVVLVLAPVRLSWTPLHEWKETNSLPLAQSQVGTDFSSPTIVLDFNQSRQTVFVFSAKQAINITFDWKVNLFFVVPIFLYYDVLNQNTIPKSQNALKTIKIKTHCPNSS